MKVFEFKTIQKGIDGRPFLVAFPASQIREVKSQHGSQSVYLVVNGVEVQGSYEEFIKELEKYKENDRR